jgi:hypothetical protein
MMSAKRLCLALAFASMILAGLASPGLVHAQPTDVFISEYVEGSSNNKAIELYNGTASAINLAAGSYDLQYYFNGSATPGLTIALTGTVPAGGVYIVAHSSAAAAITGVANQTNGSGWYNGDDAVVLRKGGVALDSLGQVGSDPGTEWGTGLTSTADNTLRRKPAVCQGDTTLNDAFNPALEWDGFAADTFDGLGSHAVTCGGGTILSIGDATVTEGDAGTVTAFFTVSLTAPAGPGGVTFDIATQDGTATTADNDYVLNSLTGQTIPAGSSTYNFNVTVNGDTFVEANETFSVNATNIVGANAGAAGLGTINNDDVTLTPIHDIQGPGGSSPIVGASVTTRGVVTGVRTNGFFIQEPDATVDADPATSEGVLVFVGAAPPAAAAVGNYVQVTGTVTEFVPTQDPFQPPLTELTSPTVVLISGGNPLPAAVALNATFPDPAGPFDQLERVEGMRVSVASLTVAGPTLGNVNEPNATATSTGVFHGVVTGVARPFREPGIQAPDPAPSGGSIPPIPRFDSNPERIRVDSDSIGAPALNVGAGAVVTNLIGPLDYTFRTYSINPEPASPPSAAGGPTPSAVSVPTAGELTVASYNLERFFDTVNDPGIGEPVLTAAAFDARLAKASLGIRDYLLAPDILGIVEVENLTTLQALAARISFDAVAASQPDPEYVAYLSEGNDVGGIDVGFLVKNAAVYGATPRVSVISVTQEGAGSLFVNPDSSTELLNDRPSLVLEAEVNHPNGSVFPITVVVNHLRSLNNSADPNSGSSGWATAGERVRAKRQAQAEELANLVQTLQTADPSQPIVLVGDFNAFEFNDGLGDSMGVIEGTPSPDNETAVPGDGVDLVNPDLVNLSTTAPASERYSFIFDGNAQSLDHIVVNDDLIANTTARREEHPRINADFPEVARNGADALRLADHDPIVAFFTVPAFATAGLTVTKLEDNDPTAAGGQLIYTIQVTNGGPDEATGVEWSDTLPADTTFLALFEPGGWTCTTPAVGDPGTVSCSIAALAANEPAGFSITVAVDAGLADGTVLTNTVEVTASSGDGDPSDNTATATTTVATLADYSLNKTESADPVLVGANLTYTLTVLNSGPSPIATVSLSDPLPAGTTFLSLVSPAGWSCVTPDVGANGTVTCTIATLGVTSAMFSLTVQVDGSLPGGTVLTNIATLTSATPDLNPGGTEAIEVTTAVAPAALTGTKSAAGQFLPGGSVTYSIVLTNTAASGQSDNPGNELTDVLPPQLTLVSATATSGTAVANVGTSTVTWNGALGAGASVTITINATIDPDALPGTVIQNQAALSYDNDGNGTNESSGVTDDPLANGAADPTGFTVTARAILDIPTVDTAGLALLAVLLALGGMGMLRRRSA